MDPLFQPLDLTPAVKLQHRAVLAPLTRCRASPSKTTPHTFVPNDMMLEYYVARATPGGLMLTEATPVSIRASGMDGIPGLFTKEQQDGWRKIVDAVHAKGAYFVCQIWHQGRTAPGNISEHLPEAPSAVPLKEGSGGPVPEALSKEGILRLQQEFVQAARNAIDIGFDLVEIHAGNGYLFDQFHHDNINTRTDEYGGSIENRCRFTLEVVQKIVAAIGKQRLGVRLTPYGFFNEARGSQRVETWQYLCTELAKANLAYAHMLEPRFDEFKNETAKLAELAKVGASTEGQVTLRPFRKALGSTILIVAGGYNLTNYEEGFANRDYELVAFGRLFTSNADLVEKLRKKSQTWHYQRKYFYGPVGDPIGYTKFEGLRYSDKSDIGKAQLED